jgi:hypothetical protein
MAAMIQSGHRVKALGGVAARMQRAYDRDLSVDVARAMRWRGDGA